MRLWRVEILYLSLVVLLLVLAVWWFPGGGNITTDSYSTSFDGRKVLFEVLQRLDEDVSRSTEELIPRPGAGDRLLILGPARYPTDREWDELHSEVLEGATLVFAVSVAEQELKIPLFGVEVKELIDTRVPDDPSTSEDDDTQTSSEGSGKSQGDVGQPKEMIERPLGSRGAPPRGQKPPATAPPAGPSIFEEDEIPSYEADTKLVTGKVAWQTTGQLVLDPADGWEVLLSANKTPQVARRDLGYGTVVVVASDEPFSNKSLIDSQKALLAYRVIESCPDEGQTWIDESLNSSGVPKMLGILFDPVFRPLTLQGALVVALFGWWGSRRFGPAVAVFNSRRRSIVEHAEALGILYYRAGAGGWAVRSMYAYVVQELRRLGGAGLKVDTAAAIARQTQLDPEKVSQLLRQIERTDELEPSTSSAGKMLWNMARILARARQEK